MTMNRHSLYCLGGGLALSVLPHSQRLPLWIMVLFLILCAGKLYWPFLINLKRQWLPVGKISLIILMGFGVAGIYSHFGTIVGLNAGVSLLVLLAGFKIMEIDGQRDFYIACFLGYFLVVTNFLYTQTVGTAIYMAFTVFIITLSLVSLNDIEGRTSTKILGKITASLLLQSIPVMFILFILFPRVSGPLWGLPNDAHSGLTGVDDEMSPGSISQLVQSNEVAFRVDFKGPPPEQSQLYWRGPVLLHTDGLKWTRGGTVYDDADLLQPLSPEISYTITLEPHDRKWFYALDIPSRGTEQGQLTSDFQLLSKEPVKQRVRYDMSSYTGYKITVSKNDELQSALQLPKGKHQQTRTFIQQWVSEGLSDQQIIEQALKLFNQDEYYYTLQPPILENDRVDQFLFQTKQGFCEHYTNAFVVMMRAAGIPARVVLGYQGGEYNPVGDYLVVHQRNAHAWAEVWRQEQGWVRIDPTAAVSPLRIIEGIDSALPNDIINMPLVFNQINLTRKLWHSLRYRWDAINNRWNQWVISYGPNQQRAFLNQLGLQNVNWSGMVFLIVGFAALMLSYIAFMLLRLRADNKDPVKILYNQFCKKLSRSGIHHIAYEGPVDFAQRAMLKRSDLASQISRITDIYIAIRYGSDLQKIAILCRHIKAFRV